MTRRPIYLVRTTKPFCIPFNVEFAWNGGFAKVQKLKNIHALHSNYKRIHPEAKLLEISSYSEDKYGIKLSAFNLPIIIEDKTMSVECAFQGSKVFFRGGPYTDLYEKTSKEAKTDERLKNSGSLKCFEMNGVEYPLIPKTAFYDWLYFNACKQNKELSNYLLQFDGFTDIVFNPEKSLNCQARSAAIYVGLVKSRKIDRVKTFEDFVKLVY